MKDIDPYSNHLLSVIKNRPFLPDMIQDALAKGTEVRTQNEEAIKTYSQAFLNVTKAVAWIATPLAAGIVSNTDWIFSQNKKRKAGDESSVDTSTAATTDHDNSAKSPKNS